MQKDTKQRIALNFLVISQDALSFIESINEESITKEVKELPKSNLSIATLSTEFPKLKELAEIRDKISDKFKNDAILIDDGCSDFFHLKLFPLIQEFERHLRKLLYLGSSLNNEHQRSAQIKKLEEKSLEDIFNIIFFDPDFTKNMLDYVNSRQNKNKPISKELIKRAMDGIEEKTFWDTCFGPSAVRTLRKNHEKVRTIRNSVMHFRTLEYDYFEEGVELFSKINMELKRTIDKIIDGPIKSRKTIFDENFYSTLDSFMSKQINPFLSQFKPISNPCLNIPYIDNNCLNTLSPYVTDFYSNPAVLDSIRQHHNLFNNLILNQDDYINEYLNKEAVDNKENGHSSNADYKNDDTKE